MGPYLFIFVPGLEVFVSLHSLKQLKGKTVPAMMAEILQLLTGVSPYLSPHQRQLGNYEGGSRTLQAIAKKQQPTIPHTPLQRAPADSTGSSKSSYRS